MRGHGSGGRTAGMTAIRRDAGSPSWQGSTFARRRRGRRVLTALGVALVAWLVVDKVVTIARPAPTVGRWRSTEGFASYRESYRQVMDTLPAPTRTHDVVTGYGTVRVYEWAAPGDRLPVVLLPGIRSGSPMWGDNLASWIGHRTVFTMDAIGDAGLSTQSVPLTSFDDQGEWVEQALSGLGLDRAHLVGHSFGGATSAVHALHHPERVASLTLIEPVMVLRPLPASTYLWSTMLLLPTPQAWKDRALAEIGGTTVAEVRRRTPMSEMIDRGSAQYVAPTLVPRTLSDVEWGSMTMPIRVDIASDKSLAGGERAAERARSLGKAPVTRWPETTHSLPMQAAGPLGEELERYWGAHDR